MYFYAHPFNEQILLCLALRQCNLFCLKTTTTKTIYMLNLFRMCAQLGSCCACNDHKNIYEFVRDRKVEYYIQNEKLTIECCGRRQCGVTATEVEEKSISKLFLHLYWTITAACAIFAYFPPFLNKFDAPSGLFHIDLIRSWTRTAYAHMASLY